MRRDNPDNWFWFHSTPEDVLRRWATRTTYSPFDRVQHRIEADEAERRTGRRARYRPRYRRRTDWLDDEKFRDDDDGCEGVCP